MYVPAYFDFNNKRNNLSLAKDSNFRSHLVLLWDSKNLLTAKYSEEFKSHLEDMECDLSTFFNFLLQSLSF